MSCLETDRLHALLDGALGPDQARACERHIAECPACRAARDAAADLRDDATALLGRTAVDPQRMPAFAVLAARAAARRAEETVTTLPADTDVVAPIVTQFRHRRRLALQAAGIAAAACAGWLSYRVVSPISSPVTVAVAPRPAASSASAASAVRPVSPAAAIVPGQRGPHRDVRAVIAAAQSAEAPAASNPEPAAAVQLADVRSDEPVAPPSRPAEPAVRIQALEPGSSALTVRTDSDFHLLADEGEGDAAAASAAAVPARSAASAVYPATRLRLRPLSAAGTADSARTSLRRVTMQRGLMP